MTGARRENRARGGSRADGPVVPMLAEPTWPTGVTAPPWPIGSATDGDHPDCVKVTTTHPDGPTEWVDHPTQYDGPFCVPSQGRAPERVARDLGVWWRLLVVASYCAAFGLGWWLRGMA